MSAATRTYTPSSANFQSGATWSVQALDAASNTSASLTATGSSGGSGTNDETAPTWPIGSSLSTSNVSQTALTLSWTAASDNVAVTSYKVYQNGTELGTVSKSTQTYDFSGLSAGTSYTFSVQAGDAASNWSSDGPTVTVSTASPSSSDSTAPHWPTGSTLTSANVAQTGLTLNWPATADDTAVTAYRVYQDGNLLQELNNVLTYDVIGLTPATQYTFQ